MTKLIALPHTAPFAPEQIAALDQVIGASSAVQRAWLAGFLAGMDAADGKQPSRLALALVKQLVEEPVHLAAGYL